jgi:Xaa-Pro aminopeptidase
MTEKSTTIIFDGLTQETIERELTPVEKREILERQAEIELLKEADQAKDNARESALAKLKALGLTEAEIAAL